MCSYIISSTDKERAKAVVETLVTKYNRVVSEGRDGKYLPLLIIITPQQNLIAAVRVCEPCHTFTHNIVNGVLQCDSPCQTKWNLETLTGISGMCKDFPPPKLSASVVGDSIVVDFSQLQVKATP